MFKASFWWPNSPRQAVILLVVLAMIVLHMSELVGLMNSTYLVFGWLPAQLAYNILYHLVGVGILYGLYRIAPEPPDRFEPTVGTGSDDSAGADTSGGN